MEFLKGGAIVGFIIALWDKIKLVAWRITSLIIQRVEFCTEDIHEVVIGHLITSYERSKIYDRIYGADLESFRNGNYGLVSYEKFGDNSILFKNKKKYLGFLRPYFVFSKAAISFGNDNSNNHNAESNKKIYSSITCLRGTLDFDRLIADACVERNKLTWLKEEEDNKQDLLERFNIFYVPDENGDNHHHYRHHSSTGGLPWFKRNSYRLFDNDIKDLGRQYVGKGKALDNLFYPTEIKELIKTIELWVKSKDWYSIKNIPWKRGWLLYGKPGTGKTALVRAFAEDLNLPIYVYSLSEMSNKMLNSAWRNMQSNTPCIALIEDFDNVFDGRKNISRNNALANTFAYQNENIDNQDDNKERVIAPLSFDCLLNCIDGVDKSNGVFTIITTNNINKIDEAIGKPIENEDGTTNFISTRPGRIDRAIELSYLTKENKILMAKKFLDEYPESLEKIYTHISKDLDETPAQFQELCSQIAIDAYWQSISNPIVTNNICIKDAVSLN